MTMIIMMMINLIGGTMVIKNGSKSKNKRRIFTHYLVSIKMVGLVCVRRREKVVEVTDSCFKNYLIC